MLVSSSVVSLPADRTAVRKAAERHWDAIVIGTGIGGGLAGRRLAERGLSVLFVEKGPLGYRSEGQVLREDLEDYSARQVRGYWPTRIEAHVDGGRADRFFGPLGSGVGGTSVFYAAALERPEPRDLGPVEGLPHPTGGWPIGFDQFLPYLLQAEELMSVRGEADPLSDLPGPGLAAPPLTEAEALLVQDLERAGLHPYRSHEALRRLPGCDACLGRKCPRACKMDGRSAGVEPALATGRAALLANAEVEDLIEAPGRITGVRVRSEGQEVLLQADVVVLAAGALHSPRLLLRSTGRHPAGCANSSGWVGRGLMLHLSELIALWPRRGNPSVGATRAISFRDFYSYQGKRLGLVQSMGVAVDAGQIAAYLKARLRRSRLARLPGLAQAATLAARFADRLLGNATIFVGILEDLPAFENQVALHPDDPDMPLIRYRVSSELRDRRDLFRRSIQRAFRRHRKLFLSLGPTLNYGHPCGTLRFGTDPATSVLNADCRTHDLDNLYVADASFMPSSTGVNPSLTIAANALRVADIIAARVMAERKEAV
jgi:choline dehydrogenase-like flavoprotein